MSCGMTESATVQRINKQCGVYLQKTTGKRYYIGYTAAGFHEMHEVVEAHAISGPCRYVSEAQLQNAEVWSKEP